MSTNRIAERAGVSVGSLYQYFPNKEALLGEVHRRYDERFTARMMAEIGRIGSLPLREAVREFIRFMIEIHEENPQLHNALVERVSESERQLLEQTALACRLAVLGGVGPEDSNVSLPKKAIANVIPGLRYHDAPAAIEWLCRAFGFETQMVVPGEAEGTIAHAQLRYGNGMIMLGTAGTHGGGFDEFMTTPRDTGGRSTQSAYVIVEDPDAHHERAVAAGAKVVMPLEDKDYGGRGYSCVDLEGHVWSFGDHDPLAD